MLVYDQLNTTKVALKEGEWYSLGSILAVAKWKFLLIGIVGSGSTYWAGMLENTGELVVRPKTVFEGCVEIISAIMGFVSFIVFCAALALFTE